VLLVNCTPMQLGTTPAFEMRNWITNAAPPTNIEVQSSVWLSPPSDVSKGELYVNFVAPADAIQYELSISSLREGTGGNLQIDRTTGRVNATLTTPGVYSVGIDILDWSNRRATIFTWNYTVVTFPPLNRSDVSMQFSPPLPIRVAVNETFRSVTTLNPRLLFTNAYGALTLALDALDDSLASGEALFAVAGPPGFDIPPGTALPPGQPPRPGQPPPPAQAPPPGQEPPATITLVIVPSTLGNFSVSMSGSDGTGRRESVMTWSFEVLRCDTTVPEYVRGSPFRNVLFNVYA